MASSMTGFGEGEVQINGTTVTVELKSVNNRYLEVSCRIPSVLSHCEREVKEIIRERIHRGKLYLTISIQGENDGVLGIRVDPRSARSIRRLLGELCIEAGVQEELRLEHLLKFSEVFQSARESEDDEETWQAVKQALIAALSALKEMRDQEGAVLTQDIVGRVKALDRHVAAIEQIAKKHLPEVRKRMLERVQGLMENGEVEVCRLESEVVLMADKMDVTEECVRLRSHNQLFLRTLEEEAVVGKKLNFLLQEMNREANTISAKATNAEISHLVVEMKEEIERIREQVQNLE